MTQLRPVLMNDVLVGVAPQTGPVQAAPLQLNAGQTFGAALAQLHNPKDGAQPLAPELAAGDDEITIDNAASEQVPDEIVQYPFEHDTGPVTKLSVGVSGPVAEAHTDAAAQLQTSQSAIATLEPSSGEIVSPTGPDPAAPSLVAESASLRTVFADQEATQIVQDGTRGTAVQSARVGADDGDLLQRQTGLAGHAIATEGATAVASNAQVPAGKIVTIQEAGVLPSTPHSDAARAVPSQVHGHQADPVISPPATLAGGVGASSVLAQQTQTLAQTTNTAPAAAASEKNPSPTATGGSPAKADATVQREPAILSTAVPAQAPLVASVATPQSTPNTAPVPPNNNRTLESAPRAGLRPMTEVAGVNSNVAAPKTNAQPSGLQPTNPLSEKLQPALSLMNDEMLHVPAPSQGTDRPVASMSATSGNAATAQQIAQQIVATVTPIKEGVTEITLRPEELGRVTLRLTGQEGAMSVVLTADRPETADLMRRHVELLGQEFKAMGYSDLSFRFSESQNGNDHHNGEDPGSFSAQPNNDDTPETPVRLTVASGLDLRL